MKENRYIKDSIRVGAVIWITASVVGILYLISLLF